MESDEDEASAEEEVWKHGAEPHNKCPEMVVETECMGELTETVVWWSCHVRPDVSSCEYGHMAAVTVYYVDDLTEMPPTNSSCGMGSCGSMGTLM